MHRREAVAALGGILALPALRRLPADPLARARVAHEQAARIPPDFFNPHQRETVTTVAELIIPATDTPGAREAGVGGFIELIVGSWYTDLDRDAFLQGLRGLDEQSRAAFGADFLGGTPGQQVDLLTALEAEARRNPASQRPTPFFSRIKSLTISGYYTSELGMRDELHYEVIPGSYDGCVPLSHRAGGQ